MNFSIILKRKMLLLTSAVFFYVIILVFSDADKISHLLNKINFSYYLVIFPLEILGFIILGWRYQKTLKKLGIRLSFKDSLILNTAASAMMITPAGSGMIIKSHILKEKIGKSLSSTTPIIIYEKWLELFSSVAMIGILLFWADFLESEIIFIVGAILTAFVFIVFKKTVGLQLVNKIISKIRFLQKSMIGIEEFQKTAKELVSPKTLAEMFSLTLITKIIAMIMIFLIFKSLNVDFNIFVSGQILFTSSIFGALTFLPGGIVATDASLLELILKRGVDFSLASILVLMIRFVTMWFVVLVGFGALKIASRKNKTSSD